MTIQELRNRRLKEYLRAEEMILQGQSYVLEGRSLTRADLAAVRRGIEDLLAAGAYLDEKPVIGRTKHVIMGY